MTLLLITLVLLLVAALALWLLKKPQAASAPVARPAAPLARGALGAAAAQVPTPGMPAATAAPSATTAVGAAAAPTAARPPKRLRPLPAALADFKLQRHEKLPAEAVDALRARLRRIPRPPMALHKLVSPAFLESASSGALSDLIMGEAQIAAKVLATVNSPIYGLRKPVASIGQAVTFLGLNSVRAICLNYMLDDSFKTSSPQRKQRFDALMLASALSSELSAKLAQKLNLPEQGALVTLGVLSFVGQLATAALLPTDSPAWDAEAGFLQRSAAEQQQLGLAAADIGSLLLQEWGLPASIIDDVRDIDAILVTPPEALDPRRGPRLALSYLCARLGEGLAQHQLNSPADFRLDADDDADTFHLIDHLDAAALAKLPEALQAPALAQAIGQMLQSPVTAGG